MRSLFAVVGAVVAVFLIVATSAFASSGPIAGQPATSAAEAQLSAALPANVQGQPDLTPSSPTGYYIWNDENGIHLRTHGPGEDHRFVARLHTDGVFQDVDAVRLESRDNFAVLDGGHTIVMRFHTYDATDGLNFRVRGGTRLRFNLQLDGELISTDSIYLGAAGVHPASNPFTIRR